MGKRKGHIPVRTCVSCGAKRSKQDLVRFVLDPQGGLLRDQAFRKEGRGAYTCDRETCVEALGSIKRIRRAFRRLSARGLRRGSPG